MGEQWPPKFVDLTTGELHDWDDIVPDAEEEYDDDDGSTLTYRELVDEIADAYGGREDLLDRMWLRFGGRPDPAPPPARDAAERCTAPGCDRLAEIAGNLGQLCWPHYETER